jgi:hypothetical protein
MRFATVTLLLALTWVTVDRILSVAPQLHAWRRMQTLAAAAGGERLVRGPHRVVKVKQATYKTLQPDGSLAVNHVDVDTTVWMESVKGEIQRRRFLRGTKRGRPKSQAWTDDIFYEDEEDDDDGLNFYRRVSQRKGFGLAP